MKLQPPLTPEEKKQVMHDADALSGACSRYLIQDMFLQLRTGVNEHTQAEREKGLIHIADLIDAIWDAGYGHPGKP